MAADQHRARQILARERVPVVPGGVALDEQRQVGERRRERLARPRPRLRPGHALRAVRRRRSAPGAPSASSRRDRGRVPCGDPTPAPVGMTTTRAVVGTTDERGPQARRRSRLLVLAGICALYTGYRWLWMETGWTRPFTVDDITMPLAAVDRRRAVRAQSGGRRAADPAAAPAPRCSPRRRPRSASSLGTVVGFALGALIAQFRVLQRGVMPYVVASQTIPILAIAPMVVVGLGSVSIARLDADRLAPRSSVIAAYLTFFPVTVNTVRGLKSADPRAIELMRSYAASDWAILWKLRVAGVAALPLRGVQDRRDGLRRRRDHRRAAVLDPGRARRRDPQLQPVLLAPAREPVGDEPHRGARSGSRSSSRRARREARRPPAPEQLA